MWAHNNIIVIGEGVAEEGIEPVVDFFTHNPELRMKTWVAVSQGEASPIVAAQTGMEAIPAISLAQLFRYQELPAKSVNSDMVDLFRDYKSETTQPLLGVLRQITSKAGGNGEVELSGSAVIKDGKLAGWLSGEESRGLSWIRKEVDNAIISVSCGGDKKVKVSAELKQIDVKLQSFIDKDKLSMKVTVVALAHISEQDKPSNNSIDEFKAEVKDLLEKRVEKEMKHSLDMVQKDFESDVVFFGRVVHIQNKREWNSWIKDNWEEIFPSIPVEVKANIDVRSSTLYQIPMIEEKVGKESKDEGTDK